MSDLTVKRWLRDGGDGQFAGASTQSDILAIAARCLDKAYSHEILGEVAFEATDGKTYVMTVEAVLDEASPEYVEELLSNAAHSRYVRGLFGEAARACVRMVAENAALREAADMARRDAAAVRSTLQRVRSFLDDETLAEARERMAAREPLSQVDAAVLGVLDRLSVMVAARAASPAGAAVASPPSDGAVYEPLADNLRGLANGPLAAVWSSALLHYAAREIERYRGIRAS
jgi:hypothetical protein